MAWSRNGRSCLTSRTSLLSPSKSHMKNTRAIDHGPGRDRGLWGILVDRRMLIGAEQPPYSILESTQKNPSCLVP